MASSTLGNIAARLQRLASYADERLSASRFEFVDHQAVLRAISDELRGLAAAAEHSSGSDSRDGS